MNTEGIGYPIYRMNEMHNMLCDIDVDKYADISKDDYAHFALKQGDILFNRTNSFEWVGRTGVYYPTSNNEERTFASYLVRLNPTQETILPEYLCAFLNSRYGVWDIKRRARQSINQTNVNPEEVKEIDIPLLRMDIQLKIQEYFKFANALRLQSRLAYDEANHHLNQLLGIDNLALTDETITEKKYSDFVCSTRLDAEYYQPKYEVLHQYLRSNPWGYKKLSEIASTYRGDLISDELYCNNSLRPAYIRGADISSNVLLPDKCVYIDDYFIPNKEFRCQYNDIVFAMIGSVGTLARVTEEFEGSFVSNNLGVIRINKGSNICAEYLHVLLTSPKIGKLLFEQKEMRTAQPKISDKDILDFIVPTIPNDCQLEIKELIDKSFALRNESNRLLELAKTAVEIAIEQGENKAMEILNKSMLKHI